MDGRMIGTCMNRHTHREWLRFLELLHARPPAEKPLRYEDNRCSLSMLGDPN